MTLIVVQCRLNSTRLPKKALLPLGRAGKPLIAWTLDALKKVQADGYYLACDEASYPDLSVIAALHGWRCFAGPEDDVLERFCLLAEKTECSVILRATGDNPFLFYEAAAATLTEFSRRNADYLTFTELPHGSGVEAFSAKALFKARGLSLSSYEHEHVGPALYRHPEIFSVQMLSSPSEWKRPDLRTTVDTPADYRRACRIESLLAAQKMPPYDAGDIISVCDILNASSRLLFVPAVQKGRGTGHLRRCLALMGDFAALSLDANKTEGGCFGGQEQNLFFADILPLDASPQTSALLEQGIRSGQIKRKNILNSLPEKGEYSLIVADFFALPKTLAQSLASAASLAAIDEGSAQQVCDCLINIIPSAKKNQNVNYFVPQYIPLPKNRKTHAQGQKTSFPRIKKVLICLGGEDPQGLSVFAESAFEAANTDASLEINCIVPGSVANLKERLAEYDLVVTHYGFTAIEAAAAGCALLLLATSPLHKKLAKFYDILCLSRSSLTGRRIKKVLCHPEKLLPQKLLSIIMPQKPLEEESSLPKDLFGLIKNLTQSRSYPCPFCGCNSTLAERRKIPAKSDKLIFRDSAKTLRRCKRCGILYMSWAYMPDKEYHNAYFFDEYKSQYGKTYLEDFDFIKQQGFRRIEQIKQVGRLKTKPAVLDIGCAFGPFLQAAKESGWHTLGADISGDAADYVQNVLKIPAFCGSFPDALLIQKLKSELFASAQKKQFDIITLWYVIEHFQNLDSVLRAIFDLLDFGGMLVFSTPSGSGVSARFNKKRFFTQSPQDHRTIWEPRRTTAILAAYGFKVKKIVSAGHHPERFPPLFRKKPIFTAVLSKLFRLGDTFEVYCIKNRKKMPPSLSLEQVQ